MVVYLTRLASRNSIRFFAGMLASLLGSAFFNACRMPNWVESRLAFPAVGGVELGDTAQRKFGQRVLLGLIQAIAGGLSELADAPERRIVAKIRSGEFAVGHEKVAD